MNERFLLKLAALDRRILFGIMAAIVAFAGLESWLLVLRAPLLELRNDTTARAELAAASAGSAEMAAQSEHLVAELARLEEALGGGRVVRSDDDQILFLMDTLGYLGTRRGVSLGSVKPGARRVFKGFEETTFDIEVRGEYRNLYTWLHEAQERVAPLVTTHFTLRSTDDGTRISLALKLTDYRPVEKAGEQP